MSSEIVELGKTVEGGTTYSLGNVWVEVFKSKLHSLELNVRKNINKNFKGAKIYRVFKVIEKLSGRVLIKIKTNFHINTDLKKASFPSDYLFFFF